MQAPGVLQGWALLPGGGVLGHCGGAALRALPASSRGGWNEGGMQGSDVWGGGVLPGGAVCEYVEGGSLWTLPPRLEAWPWEGLGA